MTRAEAVEKAHEILGIDGACSWHFWLSPGTCERLVEMILEYEAALDNWATTFPVHHEIRY